MSNADWGRFCDNGPAETAENNEKHTGQVPLLLGQHREVVVESSLIDAGGFALLDQRRGSVCWISRESLDGKESRGDRESPQ
jgi:hypothetical protein